MSHRLSLLCSLAITAPTLGACASSPSPRGARFAPDVAPLVVEVDNLNWWDMEVELDAEGQHDFRFIGVGHNGLSLELACGANSLQGASAI